MFLTVLEFMCPPSLTAILIYGRQKLNVKRHICFDDTINRAPSGMRAVPLER